MSEIDLATLLIVPVLVFVSVIIYSSIIAETTDKLNSSMNLSTEQQDMIVISQNLPEIYDWIGALSVFFIMFASIVSAFFIRSHPIYYVFFFIFSIAMLVVSGYFSNMYETIINQPALNETASNFPMMNSIMGEFPLIMLVGSILIAISMFAKSSSDF